MKKLLLLLLLPISVNAFQTSATSAILMDMDNNRVLYSKNMSTQRSIASISKIMTAIIVIENNDLNKEVIIGDEIDKAYGSGIYIKKGEKIKIIDLLYGLMLRSGNDAALALAHHTSNKFIELMNNKARELKMNDSVFKNPHGLDNDGGNISTAYDMALLTSYAMKNEIYRKIVGTKKYVLKTNMNVYSWTNKNKLLSNKYITGGKTGFTDIARRTLVTTASKDGMNLVAVTLNDGNDFFDHQNLFNEAFDTYSKYNILKKGKINVIGESYYNSLYVKNSFSYLLNESDKNNLIINYKLEKKEYENNDVVGKINILLDNNLIYSDDVYALKETKSFFDKIREWIKSLW